MQSALVDLFNLDTNLAQPGNDAIAMFRITVFDLQFTFGNCGGHDESSGLDSIGNDRVLGAAEALNAVNLNRGRSGATHARAHFIQKFRQIPHFRFASGIVNNGRAASQGGSHHQVLGPGHGNFVEVNFRADQSILRRTRHDIAGLEKNFGAKFGKACQVQINRPSTDCTATGERDAGFTETG